MKAVTIKGGKAMPQYPLPLPAYQLQPELATELGVTAESDGVLLLVLEDEKSVLMGFIMDGVSWQIAKGRKK